MRIKTGRQHQGWTVVHQARGPWRGSFQGVWLGVDEATGHWIVGRQRDGRSMDDGFDADGGWSTSQHFREDIAYLNMRRALAVYESEAMDASDVWSTIWGQRTHEAVARHLAARVPFPVPVKLVAGWMGPGLTGAGTPSGLTVPLDGPFAKYELIRYLQGATRFEWIAAEAGSVSEQEAYQLVINATGPLRFMCRGVTFFLSE
ncbi:hypothetical protein [Streptomyces clavuligerus]|uniref:hypothetical protein n=1 Tax=Streptomyces clavuligerus TaxID=1901 RepID=UPI00020D94E8|nr:hypothetical protein [Streptomyces clavuligerus]WDN56187.1 hypothetical protein LL058_30500 [Streptomyces clavuligerus]